MLPLGSCLWCHMLPVGQEETFLTAGTQNQFIYFSVISTRVGRCPKLEHSQNLYVSWSRPLRASREGKDAALSVEPCWWRRGVFWVGTAGIGPSGTEVCCAQLQNKWSPPRCFSTLHGISQRTLKDKIPPY